MGTQGFKDKDRRFLLSGTLQGITGPRGTQLSVQLHPSSVSPDGSLLQTLASLSLSFLICEVVAMSLMVER